MPPRKKSPIRSNTRATSSAPRHTKNNGQYQTAGFIARDIGGVRKEHRFIRADAYASYDDAVNFTLSKARQIVDLQGDRIFAER